MHLWNIIGQGEVVRPDLCQLDHLDRCHLPLHGRVGCRGRRHQRRLQSRETLRGRTASVGTSCPDLRGLVPLCPPPQVMGLTVLSAGTSSHWREFCHFADALSSSLLKHLLKVEGCGRMTISSTARHLHPRRHLLDPRRQARSRRHGRLQRPWQVSLH